ncbi:phosphotransferase family protein [Acidisphaera sp. L21]|uniref:phosphotransferase family protein n=1 Tax=Acidisphaera sp. L21 TaxID=1641851 RepID=UPI0020B173D5|nr:phosphotransferase family protein [Acidisphaera sp. L21]
MSNAPGIIGAPVLVPPLANHMFDEAALAAYLAAELPGFAGPMTVRQFQGGQSNPTFHLHTPGAEYVLRKKPPGTLLPSAHAVDREYTVQSALAGSAVPVAPMRLLCRDDSVIGTMFYVMDNVPGRIFADRTLTGVPAADQAAMYDDMNRVMAALHGVDWQAAGLGSFGRPQAYVARQIDRWSKQYVGSNVGDVPEMDRLMAWLPTHTPKEDETSIAHGDFRLGNLIFHMTEPRVVAVLDWELSTLGHPLADLAYNCIPWRLPVTMEGLIGADMTGIPSEAEYVAAYCRRTGRAGVPELDFFIVFSLFRWAAIAAGVYRRALDGNAADARALNIGTKFRKLAEAAWALAERTG